MLVLEPTLELPYKFLLIDIRTFLKKKYKSISPNRFSIDSPGTLSVALKNNEEIVDINSSNGHTEN